MTFDIIYPTTIPTPIMGPDGTICVNPAMFAEVGAISDFHTIAAGIAIIMFVIGMSAMYLREHWEEYFGNS